MVKKILCIVIENKLQFVVETKRAGFKVQKINGDNYIEIDPYLGRFDDFKAIWENFCEQVGIYEDVVVSSILVVDSQKKNHLEFSEYILNRLINTHNKNISSNSEVEWTNSELEEILTTIKDVYKRQLMRYINVMNPKSDVIKFKLYYLQKVECSLALNL